MEEFRKPKPKWFGHLVQNTHPIKSIFKSMTKGRRKTTPQTRRKDVTKERPKFECNELIKVKERIEWTRLCNGTRN